MFRVIMIWRELLIVFEPKLWLVLNVTDKLQNVTSKLTT